ncbi:hypothetical protein HBI56_034490 [Parastagonospora nodorum]|nr:hypothetical protein HBH51_135640 [Parastagonospora nodorum]KAH4007154.1 hypothetical protein HBI10_012130 [Parastagonospora nodorum]KAH4011505.1 hypothetical protein HBI13_198460 [Parastagonospora nodorum]KAH4034572.1 hypothetical protein HBI09_100540 [Parastagonospora nodorum]KAH4074499.1 hypothetical protein HBH50_026210 [Parastagonospora nodorum]
MSQIQRACVASVYFFGLVCGINASLASLNVSKLETLSLILLVLSNRLCLSTRWQDTPPVSPRPIPSPRNSHTTQTKCAS